MQSKKQFVDSDRGIAVPLMKMFWTDNMNEGTEVTTSH